MSKNRQKEIKRSMMRYGVSDDNGRTCKEYWSTLQFMFREEGWMYCMCICGGGGSWVRY